MEALRTILLASYDGILKDMAQELRVAGLDGLAGLAGLDGLDKLA